MILIDYSSESLVQIMGALGGDNTKRLEPNEFRHLFLFRILDIRKKYCQRFGELVFAVDNDKYWRRELYDWYKCYRKKTKEDAGYDWDMIHGLMDTIEADLREYFPYPVVNAPFAEADDVIAVLTEYLQTNDVTEGLFEDDPTPKDILISSADGDLCQLQKFKNVRQISPYTKEQVLPKLTKGNEKIKVPLNEYVLDHVLTGDGGDSIPNILTEDDFFMQKLKDPEFSRRQKPVTAKIKEFYLNQLRDDGEITEYRSPQEKLNFKRNLKMIHFNAIPKYVKENVIEVYESQLGKDRSKLLDYFIKHRLSNLKDDLENF